MNTVFELLRMVKKASKIENWPDITIGLTPGTFRYEHAKFLMALRNLAILLFFRWPYWVWALGMILIDQFFPLK